MKDIGKLLRQCREQKGLSQEYIADSLHVDTSVVSKVENGKIRVKYDMVLGFCEAMGVELHDLLASQASSSKSYPASCNINLNVEIKSVKDLEDYLRVISQYDITTKIDARYGSDNH